MGTLAEQSSRLVLLKDGVCRPIQSYVFGGSNPNVSGCNPPTHPAVIQTREILDETSPLPGSGHTFLETPQMRPNVFLCAKEDL